MKQLFNSILLFILANVAYSQEATKDAKPPATKVINELSYYWRLDSLAGNGFRRYTVHELFKSKLDTVSQQFLLEKLGRPNQLNRTNYGSEYMYYYFDIKAMPKGYDAPYACWYISFWFKKNEEYASGMVDGDIDR